MDRSFEIIAIQQNHHDQRLLGLKNALRNYLLQLSATDIEKSRKLIRAFHDIYLKNGFNSFAAMQQTINLICECLIDSRQVCVLPIRVGLLEQLRDNEIFDLTKKQEHILIEMYDGLILNKNHPLFES